MTLYVHYYVAQRSEAMRSKASRTLSLVRTAFALTPIACVAQTVVNGPANYSSTITVGTSGGAYTFDPTGGLILIDTTANSMPGIVVSGNGVLTILPVPAGYPSVFGTLIDTSGSNSPGIADGAAGHTQTLNDTSITTTGVSSDGITLQNPNTSVAGTNVLIEASGTGSSALSMLTNGKPSSASFTTSELYSENGPVINVVNGVIDLNLTKVMAGANDGRWLTVSGSSPGLTLTAEGSILAGSAITATGAVSTVTLSQGTVWDMTANSNLTTLTNNASEIDYASGGAFKTLTVNNYTGVNGVIGLNTYLGSDNSPTDQLVINGGNAGGLTYLRITNAGGPGAATVADGIPVVVTLAGATTTPTAFGLASEVRAGAYDYGLFRGGISGDRPQDWFLRTFMTPSTGMIGVSPPVSTQPIPAPPPGISTGPIAAPSAGISNGLIAAPGPGIDTGLIPATNLPAPTVPGPGEGGGSGGTNGEGGVSLMPPPSTLPPGLWPIIGPELATDSAVQPLARQMGLAVLGTLHERVGETVREQDGDEDGLEGSTGLARSAWVRVYGARYSNRYLSYADTHADGSLEAFQSGLDLWQARRADTSRDAAGVYFAYANTRADIDGLVTNDAYTEYVLEHTGEVALQSYSGAAYWTHYGASGWYLDGVVQASVYEGSSDTVEAHLPIHGTGVLTSLEAGYPLHFMLGAPFILEPQAQVIWQHVGFSEAQDGLGNVSLGSTTGTTARVGVRGQWTIEGAHNIRYQPYVRTNLWQDVGGEAVTHFDSAAVPLKMAATRLEMAVGLTARLKARLNLYGQVGYTFAVAGYTQVRQNAVAGTVGLRYRW